MFSNGNSFTGGTARECPLWLRILAVIEQR